MRRRALITGITGQDGCYLAELLLAKGYEVHGIKRRASSFNTERIDHLYQDPHEEEVQMHLHYGDLTDATNLIRILQNVRPDEIYNLAAQSHVAVSFETPEYTANVDALGALRLLEAIRILGLEKRIRFYQASTSEMFGAVQESPQRETTPFRPRSPYAAAKAYAHWMVASYREAYGLFACNGILFNHECLPLDTPLMVRRGSTLDVVTAAELISLNRRGPDIQRFQPAGLQIWDGQDWTRLFALTATRRSRHDPDHSLLLTRTAAGAVVTTAHHTLMDAEGREGRADSFQVGERLLQAVRMPPPCEGEALSEERARCLGRLAAGATGAIQENDSVELCSQLHAADGSPCVPSSILCSSLPIQAAFLAGYHEQASPGVSLRVATRSARLAQGIYWLHLNQGHTPSVSIGQSHGRIEYQLDIPVHSPAAPPSDQILAIDPAFPCDDEWVVDLATRSGRFLAGVGRIVVHNSPIRGETFVTRKITRGLARIRAGLESCLYLGNLDSLRDWGHARDYVRAQWLMLQQTTPEDYVIATGEQHSVREFVVRVAAHLGMSIRWRGTGPNERGVDEVTGRTVIRVDRRYYRPAEVHTLLGDASKARDRLGWHPQISFESLVSEMADADLARALQDAHRTSPPCLPAGQMTSGGRRKVRTSPPAHVEAPDD